MEHLYHYVGCFVRGEDLFEAVAGIRTNPLENEIEHPHVTFAYKPIAVDQSLFGTPVRIVAVGYGNNGSNEGLLVQLYSTDPKLQEMISRIEVPHITIAVNNDGKAMNTKSLSFGEIEPFELTGIYGGYTMCGKVII